MADIKMLDGAVKTDKGIELKGFILHPVVEKCDGCNRVRAFEEQKFCASCADPERKWSGGRCNFATHVKVEVSKTAKVNPLKASKRAAKGR